jgi:hypothetical protein
MINPEALSELSESSAALTTVICELEALVQLDDQLAAEGVSVESALILGRRITPSSVPPLFLRFNTECGPLEALPLRSHVPFPSLEELRFSLLNAQPARGVASERTKADEDEYANDF